METSRRQAAFASYYYSSMESKFNNYSVLAGKACNHRMAAT
jgi:hypothetical protein